MMQEFHVAYLVNYPWQNDPDASPDCVVSVRFVATSEDEARKMAIEKIPHVIQSYTDPDDEASADDVEIVVRSWAEWGAKLDKNWEAVCNTELEETEE